MPKQENENRDPATERPQNPAADSSATGAASPSVDAIYKLVDDIGTLKGVVQELNTRVSSHEKTLNWVKYIIFVAIGGGGVIFYLVDKRIEDILKFFSNAS